LADGVASGTGGPGKHCPIAARDVGLRAKREDLGLRPDRGPRWEQQRHAARDVLTRMGIDASTLRLTGLTYVETVRPPPIDPDSDVTFRKEPDAR
jgi:hypothetical protein